MSRRGDGRENASVQSAGEKLRPFADVADTGPLLLPLGHRRRFAFDRNRQITGVQQQLALCGSAVQNLPGCFVLKENV
jgi:hypothetical protein